MCGRYRHWNIFHRKRKETLPLVAAQVNSEGNMLSDTSQTESGQNGSGITYTEPLFCRSHRNRKQKRYYEGWGEGNVTQAKVYEAYSKN